jgi:hypothetical protein
MTRLPTPGGDNGQWGSILNDFLEVEHNGDGTLKRAGEIDSAVQSVNGKSGNSITLAASDISAIATSQVGANSGVASLDSTGKLTVGQVPGTVANAASNIIFADNYYGSANYASNSAALQAALNAAMAAAPATLRFTPGKVYSLDTAPLVINRSLAGLNIDLGGGAFGAGGATIQLSTGAPRAFDWNKIADYDTFQNVAIHGGIVDRNNLSGTQNHVILGNWQNASWQTRINLSNVHVSDMTIINAPITDGLFVIGVALSTVNAPTDSQCTVLQCSARRIYSAGCMCLIDAAGHPSGANTTANTWHDKILIEDIMHLLPATPTTAYSSAHVNAATKGSGGKIRIVRVTGQNSADVGIECDGFTDWEVTGFNITDAYDFAIYSVNYNAPEDVELQQGFVQGTVRQQNLLHGQGVKIGDVNNTKTSLRPSSVHLDVTYQRNTAGAAAQYEAVDIYGSRRVTGEVRSIVEIGAYTSTSNYAGSAVLIHAPDTTVRTAVDLNVKSRVTGTVASSGLINWRSFLLRDGLFTNFNVAVDSDVAIASAGTAAIIHADIGSTSGSGACSLSGRMRLVVPNNSGGGGNTPTGIQFESGSFNTVPTSILVYACDMAGLASTQAQDVVFTGASTLASKVRYRDNQWRNFRQDRQPTAVSMTMDGKADLIAVTDTTAARTITLPLAASTIAGVVRTIKDESGGATTNPITIALQGSDTFDGSSGAPTISTNYGFKKFYSTGTAWVSC